MIGWNVGQVLAYHLIGYNMNTYYYNGLNSLDGVRNCVLENACMLHAPGSCIQPSNSSNLIPAAGALFIYVL